MPRRDSNSGLHSVCTCHGGRLCSGRRYKSGFASHVVTLLPHDGLFLGTHRGTSWACGTKVLLSRRVRPKVGAVWWLINLKLRIEDMFGAIHKLCAEKKDGGGSCLFSW